MDRPSPSDPTDEPVNRLAGLLGSAKPSSAAPPPLSSLAVEAVRAIKQQWSREHWAALVEQYSEAPEGDHKEALMAFIERNWEGDSEPMSAIRHWFHDSGEPMAVLMLRDLDEILSSEKYARQTLQEMVVRFEGLAGLMIKGPSSLLLEKIFAGIRPKQVRAFALRHFDTLDIAWRSLAKLADSMPKQSSVFKAAISDLKALAEGEGG